METSQWPARDRVSTGGTGEATLRLHQPMLVGDRLFAPYGMNNGGVVQILDFKKLIAGDSAVRDRLAPTRHTLAGGELLRVPARDSDQ